MFKSSHQLLQSLPYVDRHEMSPTDPGAVHVTHPHAEESGDGGVHCRPTLSRHDVAEARNIEVGVNFQRLFVYLLFFLILVFYAVPGMQYQMDSHHHHPYVGAKLSHIRNGI